MSYRKWVREMLDRRVETYKKRADSIYAKWGKRLDTDNPGARADRAFLESHAVGIGVDICCGDFLVADAIGVDTRRTTLGADYHYSGDDLAFAKTNELDFVVTNYIEALPNVIKAMNEWFRCLKEGGTLALACRDADAYTEPEGALKSRRRCHTFNKVTISQYLHRAGFKDVQVKSSVGNAMHVTARKPE